jgi:hypothetical protein
VFYKLVIVFCCLHPATKYEELSKAEKVTTRTKIQAASTKFLADGDVHSTCCSDPTIGIAR